jgi:hypothetical protein
MVPCGLCLQYPEGVQRVDASVASNDHSARVLMILLGLAHRTGKMGPARQTARRRFRARRDNGVVGGIP